MAFGQWKRVLRRDRWNEPKGKNRSRVEKEGGGREEHPRRYSRSLRLRKSTENKDLNPEVGNRDRLLLFIEFHRLRSSKNRSKNHRDTRCKIANRVLNINLKNFHPQNCLRYIFIRGIKLLSLVAFFGDSLSKEDYIDRSKFARRNPLSAKGRTMPGPENRSQNDTEKRWKRFWHRKLAR